VGPQSAGADPGPACYGRGGDRPTVTDANLVLGALGEDQLLAGRLRMDRRASSEAIRQHIAEPLGLTVEDAAAGVEAAKAGGFRSIGLGPRERVADAEAVFSGLSGVRLADLLKALGPTQFAR